MQSSAFSAPSLMAARVSLMGTLFFIDIPYTNLHPRPNTMRQDLPDPFASVHSERLTFAQIKDKLPEDCWARQRNEHSDGEFEDEQVLLLRGNTDLPFLDLDIDDVFLILIEGDLTVQGWIGNEETDGATGLIVNGNLKARNALLGGQELYVTGNMHVDELLWGHYNHGKLVVRGDVAAALFIATEQYDYTFHGQQHFRRQLEENAPDGGEYYLYDAQALSTLIDQEYLCDFYDDGSLNIFLDREAMLDKLRVGQSVIRMEGLDDAPPAIPSLFADRRLTNENIIKIVDPCRMIFDPDSPKTSNFGFWAGDIWCYASLKESGARSIYFENATHKAFVLMNEEGVTTLGKPIQAEEWMDISTMRAPNDSGYIQLLAAGIHAVLDGVSIFEYARTLIDPQEIRRLLALPIAEPFDDYYSDERSGCWLGAVHCAYRQEGALYKDAPQLPLLRVAREYTDTDGNECIEEYFFTVQRHIDGSECVVIAYKSDQDNGKRLPISYLGGRHLQLAPIVFRVARRHIEMANKDLVEDGEPPYPLDDDDHGFALEHWRAKGYLAVDN